MRSNEHFEKMQHVVIVPGFPTRLTVKCDPFFTYWVVLVNSVWLSTQRWMDRWMELGSFPVLMCSLVLLDGLWTVSQTEIINILARSVFIRNHLQRVFYDFFKKLRHPVTLSKITKPKTQNQTVTWLADPSYLTKG